jgi:hypothetical protein
MSDVYDPVDSYVSEIKRNISFVNKLLFPRISLLIGIVGVLIAVAFLLK